MAKKKLLTLAKELDFNQEYEYFDYCIDSFINGNRSQCRKLFAAMRHDDKKALLKECKYREITEIYNFYFELL